MKRSTQCTLLTRWVVVLAILSVASIDGFLVPMPVSPTMVGMHSSNRSGRSSILYMSSNDPNPPPFSQIVTPPPTTTTAPTPAVVSRMVDDPMQESLVDIETMKQLEKQRRAQELREQEVFMKKSTGKHKCSNCDWEYDVLKGDAMMIGGQIKPNTPFSDLPSNWRCPVCRASKDSFIELVEEIPGFEVNQGYGFGTNSWTAGQKNLAVFGGLGAFFVLFLSGYALS
jgi:rubredoxin